ncbi:outer membrane beta-barrel protein [Niabella sp. CC-SYL272]|uniref:outer membrane beta-barrel protein n=1 Tax=Niabella agricola TaxID=2891571 RepID=UPI001F440138|nr:outer membrane beta-barrel protein [Niabella agricola]MCF3110326.1 outer membrane beta-barrel protein [Niabella agricola]
MSKKFSNMDDEALDKLFRDAASRFQPPDAPEGAWDAFYETKMLPNEKNTNPRRFLILRRFWLPAAACLLLALAGLVWVLQRHPLPGLTGSASVAGIAPEIIKKEAAPPVRTGPVPEQEGKDFRSLNTTIPGAGTILLEKKDSLAANNGPVFFDAAKNAETEREHRPADTIQRKPYFSLRDKAENGYPAVPGNYNPYFTEGSSAARAANSRWQVGLIAGSNLGMVRGDVSKKPGLNAGLLVQRKLGGSRFSVESGVVYESMTYDVNNADFNPNGNPVSSRVSNIEGSCTMIDVPVNVRYDVVASKKNKAFVSTGVSPTVIVKQSYIYDFDRGDGPVSINRDVSGKGKSVYAVANLSIGYEQKWEHVSVQIAPYVKIPMGEIGYGNLSLGGVGTQISIKKDL